MKSKLLFPILFASVTSLSFSTFAKEDCPAPCPGSGHTYPIAEGKVKGKITTTGDKGTLKPPPLAWPGSDGGSGTIIARTAPKVIDVNRATQQDFVIIMMLSQQVANAIVAERNKGAFKNSADFAARLCTQHSIDFGFETSVQIQNELHAPRSGEPKAAGFKCAVGQNTFETAGKKHNYVGHVTLLR